MGWRATFFHFPFFRNPLRQVVQRFRIPGSPGTRDNQARCVQTKEPSQKPVARPKPSRSPHDLVSFRRSRFVAHLNELCHRRPDLAPERDETTTLEDALRSAGRVHEERLLSYLESLTATTVYRIPFAHPDRYKLTEEAIRRKEPLIAGAALRDDTLGGYADLLMLSSIDPYVTSGQQADVDPNAYIPCEVKFSSLISIDFALQVACYASMLQDVHRRLGIRHPDYAYLCLGPPHSPPTRLNFRDLKYLFRRVKNDYISFMSNFNECHPIPVPDGPIHTLSPWRTLAKETLEDADSLQLIAGIRTSQVNHIIRKCGVSSLKDFANIPLHEINAMVSCGDLRTAHVQLHRQACTQYRSRKSGSIAYERKEQSECMPTISDGDMFFDIEGYPLIEGGLEYLLGISTRNDGSFQAWWAHTRAEEEEAFIHLITWVNNKLEEHSVDGVKRSHVFHYGHYEVSALRRVSLRVQTEEGLKAARLFESLLEEAVFFDVYKFIRSALVVGDSSYSIKSIEKIVGVIREDDELADAESSVGMYHEWRLKCFSEDLDLAKNNQAHPILEKIYEYNKQDCESLLRVVGWLSKDFPSGDAHSHDDNPEALSISPVISQEDHVQILPGACGRTLSKKQEDSQVIQRSNEISDLIMENDDGILRPSAQRTMTHLLGFYVRESSPVRRAFRDRIEAAVNSQFFELFDDGKCITGMSILNSKEHLNDSRRHVFRYSYNRDQVVSLAEGDSVAFVVPSKTRTKPGANHDRTHLIYSFMTVLGFESPRRSNTGTVLLTAKLKDEDSPPEYGSIISSEELKICDAPLRESICRKGDSLLRGTRDKSLSLCVSFLNRRRLDEDTETDTLLSLREKTCQGQKLAGFLASRGTSGVLVIQGPPGSGKTSLSARIICELISKHNKTVAVSSNSHAAIDNLLRSVVRSGLHYSHVCKVGTKCSEDLSMPHKANLRDLDVKPIAGRSNANYVEPVSSVPGSVARRKSKRGRRKASLVGATCYQLCREESEALFDFLFVDESSQVPVANFFAMGSCAKYGVLVGDQQQLEMPIKGAHPGETSKSCLSYVVGDDVATVPVSRGIFLTESYRMAPSLCQFVSNTFYDSSLLPATICAKNGLNTAGVQIINHSHTSGIFFLACDSEYEVHESTLVTKWQQPAEVSAIVKYANQLLGVTYTANSVTSKLGPNDILVVAPYNAQVKVLRQELPSGIRVGTVDKFQGQQAPVVLVSLCTGSPRSIAAILEDENEFFALSKTPAELSPDKNEFSGVLRKGLHFSLHKNRLNVAISRAQCLAVVAGHSETCLNMPISNLSDIAVSALFEELQEASYQQDRVS